MAQENRITADNTAPPDGDENLTIKEFCERYDVPLGLLLRLAYRLSGPKGMAPPVDAFTNEIA